MSTTATSPSPVRKARNYSGVPAEERVKLRREKLIQAAMDVFGAQGYAQSTMRDICAKARLAERYFYESFGSTKEVFEAVYRDQVQRMMDAISGAVTRAPLNSVALSQGGVRAFLQFIKDDPRRVQIILIDGVWMDQMKVRDSDSDLVTYIEVIKIMAQSFYPGLSPKIDVQLAASGLVAMAIHTAIAWARGGFAEDIEVVLNHNMYAWGGMRHWIKSTLADTSDTPPENERLAWVRSAFSLEEEHSGAQVPATPKV